jgi:hypothetical protein
MSTWKLYAVGTVSFVATLAALLSLWLMTEEKSPARAGLVSREVAERVAMKTGERSSGAAFGGPAAGAFAGACDPAAGAARC